MTEIDLFGRGEDAMQPYILELYDINKVREGKHHFPVVGKITQKTHAELNKNFLSELRKMIEDIFTAETFQPTSDTRQCENCKFKSICWR